MITPYLKKFNQNGGTLYVFPSVSKDLTRTFVSNDYEFKFSYFACLNIPDIYKGKFGEESDMDKGLYLNTLMGSHGIDRATWSSTDMENAITENLQNYVMNFETAILNGEGDNDDFDPDILTSVSEKVFWNWMQKVGAIQFNESGTEEIQNSIFDRTVQYIGKLDIMNTVEINGDSFEELYIHVPSTVGASTHVYFRRGDMTDNKNYLNKHYPVSNKIGTESHPEYIIGRDRNATHPQGLGIRSFVDIDEGGNIYTGDMGHTIDFRDSVYAGGEGINNMNAMSTTDFEFNAILIYYDLTEKTNKPNVKRTSTNLYGILFLDNVTDATSGVADDNRQGFLQRYPKKKETVYGNGNSYGLKLDLKIDTIGDAENANPYYTVAVPVTVSTYGEDTDFGDWSRERIVAMMHYTKALTQLQKCIDFFFTQKNEIIKLSERIATLENMLLGIDSINHMKEDIKQLYDMCDGNNIVDTAALLGLIDSNAKKLDNIMNGGKDLKLQFDTDVLQPGMGIGITKSPNKVVISSEQRYSINTVIDGTLSNETEINANHPISTLSTSKICDIKLKPGENFAVIYINDQGDCETNFRINIDDNDYNWEVGQSMKIYFSCNDGGSLYFSSDSNVGIIIKPNKDVTLSIPGAEFNGNNLIEIVCVALAGQEDTGSVNENKFIYLIK